VRNGRSLSLRSDDASYGKAVGPCLGIFKQFLELEFSEVHIQDAA
jgi:hypothetical protein